MKKRKRSHILVAILVAALLSPFAWNAGLVETLGFASGSFSSLSSYITFFNAKDDLTALYVTKEVESADKDYPAPEDDEFEFVLSKKTDGVTKIASGMQYTLRDEDGRIYTYESGQTHTPDPTQFEVKLVTDEYGMFKLKAGQTAVFDELEQGDNYIVEEVEKRYYDLISPADGIDSVTLTADGAVSTFKNMYTRTEKGSFVIRKNISYPDGYELPEMPEFTFSVKIAGKNYAGKDYTIKEIGTEEKLGTGTTDENGHLSLAGNTYAVFEDVPVDVDYTVTEILSDDAEAEGWYISGDTSYSGATKENGGTTLNFTNVQAAFAVKKQMFDGATVNESFNFQILDEKGKPYEGSLGYYLYDKTKQLISDELLYTGTDGTFNLMDGQTAVFIALPKGTKYGVREINSGRYIQNVPTSEEGYTDKIVLDSVEVLPFVNVEIPEKALLTVKKLIDDESEEGTAPDTTFRFRIERLVKGDWKPVKRAAYDVIVGAVTNEYNADSNGEFEIAAGETARFIELKKGEVYRVTEITDGMPNNFVIEGEESREGELGDDELAMVFTNKYAPDVTQITVEKKWKDESDQDGIRPDSVTVKLMADGEEYIDGEGNAVTAELNKQNDWSYVFSDLPAKVDDKVVEYSVKEVKDDVITGKDGEGTYSYEITGSAEEGFVITNTHTPELTEVPVEKEWDDGNNQDGKRPESVKITLMADGEEYVDADGNAATVELSDDNDWKYTFDKLPKNRGGKEIVYSVKEDAVKDYQTDIAESEDGGFVVTNSYEPGKTQVNVSKAWDDGDDRDGIRPDSITVKLLADGAEYTDKDGNVVTVELSESNGWANSFNDLPAKKSGKDIVYSIEEVKDDVITGEDGEGTYAIEVNGDATKGYTIKNSHTPAPETINIEGEKDWDDNDNADGARPDSITIRLYADGDEVKSKEVTSDDGWKWEFKNMPKTNDEGKEINYTISEDEVVGYTSAVVGFDVKNVIYTKDDDVGDSIVAIVKQNAKEEPLNGAQMQLIEKNGDEETVVHTWVSMQTPEEFSVPAGTYYIRENVAPDGYEVAEDVKITVDPVPVGTEPEVQFFSMTDHRDSAVPTGFSSPLVRVLLLLLIMLVAAAAYYRGYYLKRKTA